MALLCEELRYYSSVRFVTWFIEGSLFGYIFIYLYQGGGEQIDDTVVGCVCNRFKGLGILKLYYGHQ